MRLDQVVSRLFGLSRAAASALVEAGDAMVDGYPRPRSDKVSAGAWLEVTLPPPPTAVPAAPPMPVDGLRVVYHDDDIVVVDKPVGVAAHPSPGWTGPTVTGGLTAMGETVASGGGAPRQGGGRPLPVGATRLWVVGQSAAGHRPPERGV